MRVLLLLLALLAVPILRGQTVTASGGDVFLTSKEGRQVQLTSTGKDSGPLLSPDGRWVVFVRAAEGKKIETGSDSNSPSELWQIRADGKERTLLVRSRASEDMQHLIAEFGTLKFSC